MCRTISKPYQSVGQLKRAIKRAFKLLNTTNWDLAEQVGGSASTKKYMYGVLSQMGEFC